MVTPPTKSHMMALGLMPGVRTQGIRWSCQEVHHCATCVMIAKLPHIYGINTKAVNHEYFLNCKKTRPTKMSPRIAHSALPGDPISGALVTNHSIFIE